MLGPRGHGLLSAVLILGAAGLGAHLYAALYQPAAPVSRHVPPPLVAAAAEAPAKPSETLKLAAIGTFSEMVKRPLFARTRRPPLPPAAVAAARPQPVVAAIPTPTRIETGTFRLIGVVIDGDERVALVRQGGRGEIHSVSKGERVAGWTVEAVETESVKLRQGTVVDVVLLRDNVLSDTDKRKLKKARRRLDKKRKRAEYKRRTSKAKNAKAKAVRAARKSAVLKNPAYRKYRKKLTTPAVPRTPTQP